MSEIKKYLVLSNDGIHEYSITVVETDKGTVISLFHSHGEQWNEHAKGMLILSLINDGNGIKFDRKIKNINYAELVNIRILLNFEQQTDRNEVNREKYRVIEENVLIEI